MESAGSDPMLRFGFLLLLPPLLFCAGWFTGWPKLQLRLASSAAGLVLFATLAVGAVVHLAIPGLSWPAALLLGVLVSPTQGEHWAGAGLTILAGWLSLWSAGIEFTVFLGGAVLSGLFIGFIASKLRKAPPILYLVAAYSAYFLAEAIHSPGIVASCAAGFYLANKQRSPEASSFLKPVHFLASSGLFVLLGLQLPGFVRHSDAWARSHLVVWASLVAGTVWLTRTVWMLGRSYLSARREESVPGWSGFQGALSVVAALAIPVSRGDGTPFPERTLLICLAFAVVVSTLALEGLGLPYLSRRFPLVHLGATDRYLSNQPSMRV